MIERTLIIQDPVLKKGFTATPNAVLTAPGLSLGAKALYSILLMFAWKDEECWPGQEKLAEAAGCTDRTIRNYLNEPKDYGLISWVQRGLNQTNVYYIHDLATVERLKALSDADRKNLSGPDRKGSSGQDRKNLSDKEDSVEEYNVVVKEGLADIAKKEATRNFGQDNELVEGPEKTKSLGGTEQKNGAVPVLSGELIEKLRSVNEQLLNSSLLEVISQYSEEEIITALAVVLQQKHVSNPPGFFRTALEKGWEPARPYTPPPRTGPRNAGTRAGPSGVEEEVRKAKKKELIRSLYMN